MTEPDNRPVGHIPGPESNHLPVPGLPEGVSLPDTVEPPRRPGRIREQDENTTARPETVAEARARDRAQRQRAEDEATAAAAEVAAAKKKSRRRKQMIGAGVGVGVVGTIALLYAAIPDSNDTVPTQTATCVAQDGQVVADSYCSTGSYNSSTGFILLAGSMYRYNYGGSVYNGRINGGSYDRPPNTAFRTPSGQSVDPAKATSFGTNGQSNNAGKAAAPTVGSKSGKNISRGGLGSSNKGGSNSGKSSGS